MAHMHRLALAAVSIVMVADSFKPNCGIWVRFCPDGIERDVVITVRPDVMHHEAALLLSRTHTASTLNVDRVRGAAFCSYSGTGGLLANHRNDCGDDSS